MLFCVRSAGSAMLVSSVLMLLVSVNKCYYRQATDVGATESSSSIGRASQLSSDTPPTSEQQLVVWAVTYLCHVMAYLSYLLTYCCVAWWCSGQGGTRRISRSKVKVRRPDFLIFHHCEIGQKVCWYDNSWTAALGLMKFCTNMYLDNCTNPVEYQGHSSFELWPCQGCFSLVDQSSPNWFHRMWTKL